MGELIVSGLTKRFGAVTALQDASLAFAPGEIHAVIGENGAGKSTLMNLIAGFLRPTSGTVSLGGSPLPLGDPLATRARGVAMVHQHFMLVPAFRVEENLALAQLGHLRGALRLADLNGRALNLARELGWHFEERRATGELSVGVQQRLEIVKALAGDAPVLILDEPTAVLTESEVDELFRVLRDLRDRGKTVLLIAHKLREVLAVADRVSVLRRGVLQGSGAISDTSAEQLAEWMIGGRTEPSAAPVAGAPGTVVLRARNLSVRDARGALRVNGVDLEVASGEILGIGGVEGNGQIELAEALAGVRAPTSGVIEGPRTVGYIPQDRHVEGLALGMAVLDNFLIAGQEAPSLRQGPFLRVQAARTWAAELANRYSIKMGKLEDPARSLSGGNQQKIVVSRTLALLPDALVAVNPTRGLDFSATAFVHQSIREASSRGAAVLLVTTDREELETLATRRLYLGSGRLVSDLSEAIS